MGMKSDLSLYLTQKQKKQVALLVQANSVLRMALLHKQ